MAPGAQRLALGCGRMMIQDLHDLSLLNVDETHEDRICQKISESCTNEAVMSVAWACPCGHVLDYCLPHWQRFWTRGAPGRPTCWCKTVGGEWTALWWKPIPR